VVAIITFLLLTAGIVFLGNQRQVQALDLDLSGLAHEIVCQVFSDLNEASEGIEVPFPIFTAACADRGGLTVVKVVNGGSASAVDFQIHVKSGGNDISESPKPGASGGRSYGNLVPGTYTVNESGGPSGYMTSFSGDCDAGGEVSVTAAQLSTCTITNTFSDAVVPECSNNIDDDGDSLVDEADPACHTDGNAGNPSSYDPDLDDESLFVPQCSDGIDNDNDGKIDDEDPGCSDDSDNDETDPSNGGGGGGGGGGSENTLALCSDAIDNDGDSLVDLADPDCAAFKPTLTIVKHTSGGDGIFTFTTTNASGTATTTTTLATSGGFATSSTIALDTGTSTVTEESTVGWDFTGTSCIMSGPNTALLVASNTVLVHAAAGGVVTCTFSNMKQTDGGGGGGSTGILVVKKVFANATTTPSEFSFSINGTATTTFEADGQNDLTVAPGTYTVLEVATTSWVAQHDNCSNVIVETGTSTTCTITNTPATTTPPNGGGGGGLPACSDGIDNDGDNRIDNADPGCHLGGDVTDERSYKPEDNDELDSVPAPSGGGSGGGGGGGGSGGGITNPVYGVGGALVGTGGVGGGGGVIPPGQVLGTTTPTIPSVPSSCSAYISGFLRMGRDNDVEQVRRLQLFLNSEMNSGLPITGFFGPLTDAAVRAFQRKYTSEILTPWGISEPTGYVFLTTRKKINELYCRGASAFPLTPQEQQVIDLTKTVSALVGSSVGQGPPTPGAQAVPGTLVPTTSVATTAGTTTTATSTAGAQFTQLLKDWWWLILLILLGIGAGWYFWQENNTVNVHQVKPPQPPTTTPKL